MYHYYLPLQQLFTHIYSNTTVDIGRIEPNHLSTLHHTPERQDVLKMLFLKSYSLT